MSTHDDDRERRSTEIAQLVEAIQRGGAGEASYERLYHLTYREVDEFFRRRSVAPAQREELTQKVFLRVYRNIGDFRREAKFSTWLQTIAKSVHLNEIRRQRTQRRKGVEVSLDDGTEDELRPLHEEIVSRPGSPQGPLEDLLAKERRAQLAAAIRELPPQMRRCFVFRYHRGFKYREIAFLMKISIQTVRAHLHQAKLRLKLDLGDDAEE